jgi:hypothetical protein
MTPMTNNQDLIRTTLALSECYGVDPEELTLERDGVALRSGLMIALQDLRSMNFLRGSEQVAAWAPRKHYRTVLSFYLAPMAIMGMEDPEDLDRSSYFRVVAKGASLDFEFLRSVVISGGWTNASVGELEQKRKAQRLVAGTIQKFGLRTYPGHTQNGDGCYVMGHRALLAVSGADWVASLSQAIDSQNPWPSRPGLSIGIVSQILRGRREALERAQSLENPNERMIDSRRFMTLLTHVLEAGAQWSLKDSDELEHLENLGLKIPSVIHAYSDRCRLISDDKGKNQSDEPDNRQKRIL